MDKEKYEEVPQSDLKGSAAKQEDLNNNLAEKGNGDKICLKPKMSLLNGITVIVGSIIGSGIFITQKGVLTNTGSVNLSILIWVISGVFSLIGAYCYAELGCMITKTGKRRFSNFRISMRRSENLVLIPRASRHLTDLSLHFLSIRCRLRLHHAELRTIRRIPPSVGRVYDHPTGLASDRGLHVRLLRSEAVLPDLRTTGRGDSCSIVHLYW